MRGNLFECGNEVFIEGKSIGNFQSFELSEDRTTIANTATILIPIYAIGRYGESRDLPPSERIRETLAGVMIKPGARIDVYCWYYDNEMFGRRFERLHVFSGFIRQVIGGFPSTLICEDYSFILRFGTIEGKNWLKRTSLTSMLEFCIPISNEAFQLYRERQGFPEFEEFNRITLDLPNSAQAEFTLDTVNNISPYEAISKLLKMFSIYVNVDYEGRLYAGIGLGDKTKRNVLLATNENVIERDIKPTNGLFENYQVEVTGLLSDGSMYTRKIGDSEGIPIRQFAASNEALRIDQTAESLMAYLLGDINKGTIKTLLYPDCRLFDFIEYTDTLFPELSDRYYVIGRNLKCDDRRGYIQTLSVTAQRYIL